MPKKDKKRKRANPNQTKDFTKKAKKKIGKRAKASNTTTNTSFKAKSIVLPEQSILQEKGTLVNKRNLTFDDLITQLSHYSASVRKDALLGLKDLFTLHPQLLAAHLAPLFDKTFEMIVDSDANVRTALHTLFGFIMPLISAKLMRPFMNLLVMFINNAMTHLTLDIRLSALPIIKLLLTHYPQFVPSFYTMLLRNYLDLLSSVGFGSSSSVLSKDSSRRSSFQKHLPILQSLYHLLKAAHPVTIASDEPLSSSDSWNWENSKKTNPNTKASFFMIKPLLESSSQENETITDSNASFIIPVYNQTNSEPPSISKSSSTKQFPNSESEQDLGNFSKMIIPMLLNRWLECSPSDPSISTTNLECMSMVLDIIHILFSLNEQGRIHTVPQENDSISHNTGLQLDSYLNDFLKYLLPHFPVAPFDTDKEKKSKTSNVEILVERINMCLCALMAFFIQPIKNGTSPDDAMDVEAKQPDKWLIVIFKYVESQLREHTNSRQNVGQQQMSLFLPIVRRLLPSLPLPLQRELMQAFHIFYTSSHILSTSKRECVKWIAHLLTSPKDQYGGWHPEESMMQQWILSLPQILWKLQTKNLESSQVILSTLIYLVKCKHPYSSEAFQKSLQSLKEHMTPFFFVQLTATKTRPATDLFGPFIELPENLQRMSLELIQYFDEIPSKLQQALVACSRHVNEHVFKYMGEILFHLWSKGALPISDYLSIIMSLLVANSVNRQQGKAQPGKIQREKETDEVISVLDDDDKTDENRSETMADGEEDKGRQERKRLAELLAINMRLWDVGTALVSMEPTLVSLLKSEHTRPETRQMLLLFLTSCFQTINCNGNTWMPPLFANSLPSIFLDHIFALNGEDFTHSSTVNSNGDNIHGLEDCMDMLASYPLLLSTLMIAMRKRTSQDKTGGQIDPCLRLTIALLRAPALRDHFHASPLCKSQVELLARKLMKAQPPLLGNKRHEEKKKKEEEEEMEERKKEAARLRPLRQCLQTEMNVLFGKF